MRGKPYPPEVKERALAELATTSNIMEVSRRLGIPDPTLHGWLKEAEEDQKYKDFRDEKKKEFVQAAWDTISDALLLGNKRVKRALEQEGALDEFIDIVEEEALTGPEKTSLINKIKQLQVQNIRDISTYVGTIYDKAALAAGDATARGEITGKDGAPIEVVFETQLKQLIDDD
jgi:transposase-like protein